MVIADYSYAKIYVATIQNQKTYSSHYINVKRQFIVKVYAKVKNVLVYLGNTWFAK